MALPKPVPGLILRYSYLWRQEFLRGREEGRKDRPCAIIAAIRTDEADPRVLVLPVTHSPPADPALAVEIPLAVKRRIGLDDAPAWVVVSEWNEFIWPGPDLRRLPGAEDATVAYGMLPPSLFNRIRERFVALVRAGRSRGAPRL